MNRLNLSPAQVAVGIVLIIAIFIGGLVMVSQFKGSPDDPLHIRLVSGQEGDAADTSIPSDDLTPAAQSGVARLFIGYTDTPRARVYNFLQGGGLAFDVSWSSVRGGESHISMPNSPLPSWTNPTTCTAPATECGHLAVAIPVSAPPGRPEIWVLDAGAEMPIDGSSWGRQNGELTLDGRQYFVISTDAGDVSAGATVSLKWPLPWDGRGAPDLPAP